MPRQTSFQATEATDQQLADLRGAGFGTTTDVIRLAVDRMYREEIAMKWKKEAILWEGAGYYRLVTKTVITPREKGVYPPYQSERWEPCAAGDEGARYLDRKATEGWNYHIPS